MTQDASRFQSEDQPKRKPAGDPNDMDKLIRQMVVEEEKAGHAPRPSDTGSDERTADAAAARTLAGFRNAKSFVQLPPQEKIECRDEQGTMGCIMTRLKTKLAGWSRTKTGGTPPQAQQPQTQAERPESSGVVSVLGRVQTRHAIWAVLGLLIVFKPTLIAAIVLIVLFIFLATYGTLGPEGMGDMTRSAYQWYKKRRPERAERLRARLDGFAMKADEWLDRIPGTWAESLYLPDFGPEAMNGEAAPIENDPFDRLGREHV